MVFHPGRSNPYSEAPAFSEVSTAKRTYFLANKSEPPLAGCLRPVACSPYFHHLLALPTRKSHAHQCRQFLKRLTRAPTKKNVPVHAETKQSAVDNQIHTP